MERPEGASWPVERSSHAATCLNYGDDHPQLLVTGGLDKKGKTLSDAWLLDINTGRWREVSEVEGCVCVTKPRMELQFTVSMSAKMKFSGHCPAYCIVANVFL